ncbi:hypothetical protein ACH4Y0_06445 [Streptomyces sp. NPDC020707]|nr:hypothetical protein [Streptomyces sp. DSM 40484]
MSGPATKLCAALLRVLLPARGRHRAAPVRRGCRCRLVAAHA